MVLYFRSEETSCLCELLEEHHLFLCFSSSQMFICGLLLSKERAILMLMSIVRCGELYLVLAVVFIFSSWFF